MNKIAIGLGFGTAIGWTMYKNLIVPNKIENKIHKEIGQIISSFDRNEDIINVPIPTAYSTPDLNWTFNPSNPYLDSSLTKILDKYPNSKIKISYDKYPSARRIKIECERNPIAEDINIEFQ